MEQMIFGDVLESVKKHKFSSGPKVYSTGMTNEEISKLLVHVCVTYVEILKA
jgi:hypothetical protein